MTALYYDEYRPTFADRSAWDSPTVLRERAKTHGDGVYLDVPWAKERYTFAETLDTSERIGTSLLANGAEPGDRVLIMLPNCSAFIFTWLGSSLAGLVEVPINTAYRGSFLAHQVRTTSPTFAVIDPEYAERFADIRAAAATIARFYLVGDKDACAEAEATLSAAGLNSTLWEDLLIGADTGLPTVAAHDLASVFFTSGTTGLSKGVMMPHAQMYFFADEGVSLTRLTDADAYFSTGPLFHGNAHFLAAYPALVAGARYVLGDRFTGSGWLDQARDAGATVSNLIGVMMEFVWQQKRRPDDADNQLRCIFAAPTASSILEPFKERYGVEAFVEVFGLTEIGMPILTPYGIDRPAGAAGVLNAEWFDLRLVDSDTDEEVPVGDIGELVVRSRYPWTMCQGYFGMPDKTADAFRNLWFHTGDGLKRDDTGWYYFVDRLKDAIRRRGENISSFEVEQGLLAHPAIAEVAVVGVPADQEAGEDEVMVFVVAEPGGEATPEDIWAYADKQLPAFAVPRYLRLVDELPKTPSAKVRKVELREHGVDGDTFDRGPAPRRKPSI